MAQHLSPPDLVGLIGSTVACVALLLRRNMLRERFSTWHSASWPVRAALAVLAIYMGMAAVSIFFGAHAGQREAFAYAVLAAVSVVLVVNLDQSGRTDGGSSDEA